MLRSSLYIKGLFIIVGVLLSVVAVLFVQRAAERIRAREQRAVDLWVKSINYIIKTSSSETTELSFIFEGILSNIDFPAILTDRDGNVITAKNIAIDSTLTEAQQNAFLKSIVTKMDAKNPPIAITLGDTGESHEPHLVLQYVHYGESALVRQLRIAPFVAIVGAVAFALIGYVTFSNIRKHQESSVWVGMAKETAHQLGTPMSSMLGWIELLKLSRDDPDKQLQILTEMESDVSRLNRVATRFSKIGSKPNLKKENLYTVVKGVMDYHAKRISYLGTKTSIRFEMAGQGGFDAATLDVPMNKELFEWVLENIIKNAIDAVQAQGMDAKGLITASISQDAGFALVDISDNGKGIDSGIRNDIFRAGFTTKDRGWGLGLSLAKRITDEYHGGKLILKETKLGKGTTFRIKLKI
jgi:nitrogen fixation/metabolism regulation signal transduction histidine kinase